MKELFVFMYMAAAGERGATGCTLPCVLQEGEVSEHERKPGGWTHG